jgi:serine protease AprX
MFDEKHVHGHAQNSFAVIPTAEKLNAGAKFTGKGVTIAFLDSGFYPHPDFAERIIKFHDVSGEEKSFSICCPQAHHWHGTQTVAVCAGNGKLSDGIYRGLASNAELVLVKVSEKGRINDENIEKGLKWLLENHRKLNIRVLNMSLGGDEDVRSNESRINILAEELIKQGVCITVAAGNSSASHSIPPANSPSVITVGGYSDENRFSPQDFKLYHSNFGKTLDGFVKPELIAPAMFVAAPILPETDDYEIAEALSFIAHSPNYSFRKNYLENWERAKMPSYILSTDVATAKNLVEEELQQRNIISTHYKSVDGTSFAAPITASVIAQMLEANPNLTPLAVKNILISTAVRLPYKPLLRQGYGVLNAESAVSEAIREMHYFTSQTYAPPSLENEKIVFSYHDDFAETVYLAGEFNDWQTDVTPFIKYANGFWKASIKVPKSGKYAYKILVNDETWLEDATHSHKEEDGFGGFNSILIVD